VIKYFYGIKHFIENKFGVFFTDVKNGKVGDISYIEKLK